MGKWGRISSRLGIYRDTQTGWIAGVCAGIANRLTIKPIWIRGLFVLAGLFNHGVFAVVTYFALAFLLKPRAGSDAPSSASGAQMAYRELAQTVTSPFGPAPGTQVAALKDRFASLDLRLNGLEAAVMSDELSLRRKFKDIGA